MSNVKLIILFVFISFALLPVQDIFSQKSMERTWQKDLEKVRIISYNILNGFDNLTDTDRMNRMADWIREKDPEVLALQELVGFKEKDLKEFAQLYGHPYVAIVKENGYPVGITSKRSIQIINKQVEGYWHGMMHVRTYGLDFIVTHLSPSDKDFRRKEAFKIISYIQENKLDSCLVMGDLNSLSPFDADEIETHIQVADQYKFGTIDYSVQSIFLSLPLIDVCRLYTLPEERTTFPTRILSSVSKRRNMHKVQGERLDYIFVTPSILDKCVDGFIWNGEDTDYLSDHYPVGIDMMLKK